MYKQEIARVSKIVKEIKDKYFNLQDYKSCIKETFEPIEEVEILD
jgi:hypothetical protein